MPEVKIPEITARDLYFVDTKPSEGQLDLHQLCSVESAARVNQRSRVKVILPQTSAQEVSLPKYLQEAFENRIDLEKLDFVDKIVTVSNTDKYSYRVFHNSR